MNSMKEELLEVVFEGLDSDKAVRVARMMIGGEPELPTLDEGVRETALANLKLKGGMSIKNAHVRVLCYEGPAYDVEVNFTVGDADARSKSELQSNLHSFSLELAGECGVQTCYAGLEPAADEGTRIFTNENAGPVFLKGAM